MLLDLDILTPKRRHFDLKMGHETWKGVNPQVMGHSKQLSEMTFFDSKSPSVRNTEREPPMGNVIAQALTLTSHG